MEESKPLIGLKWEPKLPGLSLDSRTGSSSSKGAERHGSGSLWTSKSELVDGLCLPPNDPRKITKMIRKQVKDTAGSNWFDMPAPTMTLELKRDLQLLKIGTVVEPAEEFYGRLTKKNRKTTLADELMSDPKTSQFRKRKVREIEENNRAVENKKWKRKGKDSKNTKQIRN